MIKYIVKNLTNSKYLKNVDIFSDSCFSVLEKDYKIFHTDDIKSAKIFNSTKEAISVIRLFPEALFEIIKVYNLR